MPHPASHAAIIGCDVGKRDITVHQSHAGTTQVVPNTLDALERFLTGVEADCLVVCESTGGYETALLQAALLTGRPAHRADARKVKAFIRSFGTPGKTNALDAKALARYGAERHAGLARWQAPDASRERLQVLVLMRQDLVVERQGHRNRVLAPRPPRWPTDSRPLSTACPTRSTPSRPTSPPSSRPTPPSPSPWRPCKPSVVIANAVLRAAEK